MTPWLLALACLAPLAARADIVTVPPGGSIQAAIAAAANGDEIVLEAGTYDGDLDWLGKAVQVRGVGPMTVIRGTGTGPVVTFASGETPDAVLADVQITGGVATNGGAIRIAGASPTVRRTVLIANRALARGSAVAISGGSTAYLANNLVLYNTTAGGDPHSIDVTDSSPTIVNNTVVRGDSNAIIVRGASSPLVMNNVLASNGSATAGERRGRGICDFSVGGTAVIAYNVFHRNRVAALLTDGRDFRAIRGAQRRIGPPRLEGNRDGRPGFARRIPRTAATATPAHFRLTGRGRATDAGNPDPTWNDLDGTRNDAGFTGGPLAPNWPD